MPQTNVIVLRIARDKTSEFEELFRSEQYENWKRYQKEGKFLAASLTRVEYGSESDEARKAKYVNYVVVAKLSGMTAHTEHDNDPAFKSYDEKADAFQPEGPSVYGGTTLFEIG